LTIFKPITKSKKLRNSALKSMTREKGLIQLQMCFMRTLNTRFITMRLQRYYPEVK